MNGNQGMGWLRDYPDFRDLAPTRERVEGVSLPEGEERDAPSLLAQLSVNEPAAPTILAAVVDLGAEFPPVEDQGSLGSCTANAGVALVEYFERRASGNL